MSWDKYIKKYVWDDNKTPYFVPVRRLNRSQADHELFAYTIFIALLFAVISIISLTENAPQGKSHTVALYAFSVSYSAVLFGVTKHVYAAYYLAMAPLATRIRPSRRSNATPSGIVSKIWSAKLPGASSE